jgi:hypothetical protein
MGLGGSLRVASGQPANPRGSHDKRAPTALGDRGSIILIPDDPGEGLSGPGHFPPAIRPVAHPNRNSRIFEQVELSRKGANAKTRESIVLNCLRFGGAYLSSAEK